MAHAPGCTDESPCHISIDHPNSRGDFYDRTGGDAGERGSQPSSLRACETPRPAGLKPLDQHAFNAAVNQMVGEVTAISDERGADYGDTWALENQVEVFSDHVAKLTPIPDFDRQRRRLRRCADMIDTKLSRLLGGWRHDHGLDLLAYIAAFTRWRDEYEALVSADKAQFQATYPPHMVPDSESIGAALTDFYDKR